MSKVIDLGLVQCNNTNYKKGRSNGLKSIKYIVVHYTGNKGDTAINNAIYFQGLNRKASAHYFIDETTLVKSVLDRDTAWHVGKDYSGGKAKYWGKCNNNNSVGLEMCSDWLNGKYIITEETQKNTIYIIRRFMKAYGIPKENVIRHYDVCGKICPVPMIDEKAWKDFKEMI